MYVAFFLLISCILFSQQKIIANGTIISEKNVLLYSESVNIKESSDGIITNTQCKTRVCPLTVYHGKVGSGLSVVMSVKQGAITLLSVVESANGKLMLLTAEGESVSGPILEIGNTNSRYCFSIGARGFVNAWNSYGPAHHCAVGVGHISSRIEKLGRLLNVDVVKVC
ncbi:MAG: hypothetical protein ABIN04_12895 [Ginsengibacter sp.]